MNELPVIVSLRLYKKFWDCHLANITKCLKEICGEGYFDVQKALFWNKVNAFRRSFITNGLR